MPDLISAINTRALVSYAVSRVNDEERIEFPNNGEIYDCANKICREIARHSKLLKADLYIPLIPNQLEYSYLQVADHLINVVQVETVTYLNGDIESAPLTYRNKKVFRNETIQDTTVIAPTYYTYDNINIAYWRPVGNAGGRLKLRVARDLYENELLSNLVDPPFELWARYSDYIKYGTVSEMCLARPDNEKLQKIQQNYERLYKQYKDLDLIPKTLDTHVQYMREF